MLLKEADTLRKVPLFAKVEPSRLKLLAFTSESLSYEDGEVVFEEGDLADAVYVIIDGEAEILADTGTGRVSVGRLGKDELFGELAVLNNAPRSATLRARGHLKVLRIDGEKFVTLLADNQSVALAVIRQLSVKLARAIPR
jgi:CRP-like cAMP-binding protein